MSEEECAYTDWRRLGETDGSWGEPISQFGSYTRACSAYDITPNYQSWMDGRALGLESFCTPEGAYRAGRNGRGDIGQCTLANELAPVHFAARGYWAAENRLLQARRRYEGVLLSLDRNRGEIRQQRRRLRRDDLGEKERRRAEDRLRFALEAVDRYPFQESQARFSLLDAERELDAAQRDLFAIEDRFGLGGFGRY